jgi:hypothetical protein
MAIIEKPITGEDRKNMGNVVFFIRYGKYILRTKPLTTKNPRTPPQQLVRVRFKKTIQLIRQVLSYINEASPYVRGSMRAYNRIVS